jgi:DNA-binding YbaB/EbfC family protein
MARMRIERGRQFEWDRRVNGIAGRDDDGPHAGVDCESWVGMLGGFGNILELMKGAKDIQARMADFQNELAHQRYDAQTGGGAVRVVVDGKGAMVDIKIDPSAAEDVELLEDLIKSAVISATTRAHEAMRAKLAELTGGLNIPGLDNMLPG